MNSSDSEDESLDDDECCCGICVCCPCFCNDNNCTCFGQDICGIACCFLGWFTLLFVSGTVWTCLKDISLLVLIPFQLFVLLAMGSHLMALFGDPGFVDKGTGVEAWEESSKRVGAEVRERLLIRRDEIIEMNSSQTEEIREVFEYGKYVKKLVPYRKKTVMSDKEIDYKVIRQIERYRKKVRYCNVCESFKPKGAHHCSVCKRCVQQMDHHCPWVNNCVGSHNLRFFLQFLFYVLVSSIYALSLFCYRSYIVLYSNTFIEKNGKRPSPWPLVACVFSVILCFFFCIFVTAMSCDQYGVITTGVPGIDSLQGQHSKEQLTIYQGLKKHACFGRGMNYMWFLPIPLKKRLHDE